MRFQDDVLQAWRSLRRAPAFALWVLCLLTLTLTANALLFTLVERVVLRPLPFREPERLAWVWSTRVDRDQALFSLPDYVDFRDQNRTVENFAVFTQFGGITSGPGGPERWAGVRATANALELLGVEPALGRVLSSNDGRPESPNVMMLTHGFWQRRFGGAPDAVGQSVTVGGANMTIVGVLPRNFIFPGMGNDLEFVTPLVIERDPRRNDRDKSNFLRGFARLKPGVTLQQAYDDFAAINQRLRELYPDANAKKTPPRFFPLQQELLGDFHPALLMLLAAVSLVLLLAAINLANLLQVRAWAREKELAVRMALGAGPRQLVRMLLSESMLLAAAGGVTACVLAWLSLKTLLNFSPQTLPRVNEIEFGAASAFFTMGLALATGLIMGAGPTLRARRALSLQALNAEGRGSSMGRSRRWALEALVFGEVAIATLLLIATGLFLKSYVQLQSVSPGFEAKNVLMLRPALPGARYGEPAALQRFTEQLQKELESIAGVESAAMVSSIPMGLFANNRMDFEIAGRPAATKAEVLTAQNRQASPRYFSVMRIPILEGREFTEADTAESQRVVIVDAALALQYFPGTDAIGQSLIIEGQPNLIVGIAGQVKHFGLDDPPVTTFYQPLAQIGKVQASFAAGRPHFVVRTKVPPLTLVPEVRRRLARVDASLPVAELREMEQYLDRWIAPRRFNLQLLMIFAAFAVLLAGLGIHAVLAAAARQRTQEIGIRKALGASDGSILRMVLQRTLWLSAAAALILIVALGASLLPAWRASRVDPLITIRGN